MISQISDFTIVYSNRVSVTRNLDFNFKGGKVPRSWSLIYLHKIDLDD